jgi:hypothetical protein
MKKISLSPVQVTLLTDIVRNAIVVNEEHRVKWEGLKSKSGTSPSLGVQEGVAENKKELEALQDILKQLSRKITS